MGYLKKTYFLIIPIFASLRVVPRGTFVDIYLVWNTFLFIGFILRTLQGLGGLFLLYCRQSCPLFVPRRLTFGVVYRVSHRTIPHIGHKQNPPKDHPFERDQNEFVK